MHKINPEKRVTVVFYAFLLDLNITLVGYVASATELPPMLSIARTAALLASMDISFVVLSILAPLSQLIYSYLNFGGAHHSIHKLHFHRNMAFNALLFSVIHIVVHVITWIIDPSTIYNNKTLHSIQNPSFITGIVMFLSFSFASITGYTRKAFSSHIVLALIGTLAFFFHGFQKILGPPIGDYLVIGTLLTSLVIYTFFNVLNPINKLQIEACITPSKESRMF